MKKTRHVAVLGAGTMGAGIAQVFATHGWEVTLCDLSQQHLQKAIESIRGNLQVMQTAGLAQESDVPVLLGRIAPETQMDRAVATAQIVVEAVSESKQIKALVFDTVFRHAPSDAVVWSNTSTLDVFALAPEALRPRLLIAHWFAPPHILPLVEVVRGDDTLDEVVEQGLAELKRLGKAPVLMDRYVPGFVINRLLRALGREALYLIDNGYITAERLDQAVRTSLAPRMLVLGVMQRYDFTGLDLSAKNLENADFLDAPVDLKPRSLFDHVQAGELGVKSGKGFYDYAGMTPIEATNLRDALLWQVVTQCESLIMAERGV